MDFYAIFHDALPSPTANATQQGNTSHPADTQLPDSLMGLLHLVGLSHPLVRGLLLAVQAVGLTNLSPIFWVLSLVLAWRSGAHLWAFATAFLRRHLTTSITIDSDDDLARHLTKWMTKQPALFNSRNLAAETDYRSMWDARDIDDEAAIGVMSDASTGWLNFSNQWAKSPPQYVPAVGHRGAFWFGSRYFSLSRTKSDSLKGGLWGGIQEKETITISTYGWSPDPIKDLIQHTKAEFHGSRECRTTIKRPRCETARKSGSLWQTVAHRPVRPMSTVVLEEDQKLRVLRDINEYLHPSTPRWYASRGIPLRRGYLFYGPPGTGKTSLSFALAGVFGLDIYVISLLEPTLSEEDFSALFSALPRRCIILLEDIDTAGLGRLDDEDENADSDNDNYEEKSKNDQESGTQKRGKDGDKPEKKMIPKRGISLSGLLNTIDGVASHEGRILIMTTNKPESLDPALIRPGRVDLQVEFAKATREQAVGLFERMYEVRKPDKLTSDINGSAPEVNGCGGHGSKIQVPPARRLYDYLVGTKKTTTMTSNVLKENGHGTATTSMKKNHVNGSAPMHEVATVNGNGAPPTITKPLAHGTVVNGTSAGSDNTQFNSLEERNDVAKKFASHIPEGKFTPAEIQGFLLMRKREPRTALADVVAWAEALMEQKAKKTKITRVQ